MTSGQYDDWLTGWNKTLDIGKALYQPNLTPAAKENLQTLFDYYYNYANDQLATMSSVDPNAGFQARELQRQGAVTLGKYAIDNAFTKFTPDYFDKYKSDYTGYYFPQVDEQYRDANSNLRADLRDRGMAQSTVGIDAIGDLGTEYTRARTNIANEAQDAANKLRGTVEQSKTDLYALNQSAADPMGANARATAQASAIVAPPQYSPLGQIFAAAIAPFSNAMSAYSNRSGPRYSSPVYGSGSSGSGRVIG